MHRTKEPKTATIPPSKIGPTLKKLLAENYHLTGAPNFSEFIRGLAITAVFDLVIEDRAPETALPPHDEVSPWIQRMLKGRYKTQEKQYKKLTALLDRLEEKARRETGTG